MYEVINEEERQRMTVSCVKGARRSTSSTYHIVVDTQIALKLQAIHN